MKTIPLSNLLLAFSALTALIGSACGSGNSESDAPASDVQGSEPTSVQIDHLILAVGDLGTGMDEFEEMTGVRPAFGGEHPGMGTRNALVSLGPRIYLEVLALQEGTEEVEDAPGLAELTELTPWGWGASTTDLETTLALLRTKGFIPSEMASGSRATPENGLLRWETAFVEDPVLPGAPFFIEWDPQSPHPATTSPGGCELESLKIMTPDHEGLGNFLGILGLPVQVTTAGGSVEEYAFTLRCPAGTVTFQ